MIKLLKTTKIVELQKKYMDKGIKLISFDDVFAKNCQSLFNCWNYIII